MSCHDIAEARGSEHLGKVERQHGVQPLEVLLPRRQCIVGKDRPHGTLQLAHQVVEAFVLDDDEEVRSFVEGVHRTDQQAIHVLALDAAFSDY